MASSFDNPREIQARYLTYSCGGRLRRFVLTYLRVKNLFGGSRLPTWPCPSYLPLPDMLPRGGESCNVTFHCALLQTLRTSTSICLKPASGTTNVDVSDDGLFVEPVEFFEFFIFRSAFQLPHVLCGLVKISLRQKTTRTHKRCICGVYTHLQARHPHKI